MPDVGTSGKQANHVTPNPLDRVFPPPRPPPAIDNRAATDPRAIGRAARQAVEMLEARVLLSTVTVTHVTTRWMRTWPRSPFPNCRTATSNPDGLVSLREAVRAARNTAGVDTVDVPAGTYVLSTRGTALRRDRGHERADGPRLRNGGLRGSGRPGREPHPAGVRPRTRCPLRPDAEERRRRGAAAAASQRRHAHAHRLHADRQPGDGRGRR